MNKIQFLVGYEKNMQDNTKGVGGHSHKRDGRRIMDAAEYRWKDTTTVPKQTMNVVHHTQAWKD